MIVWQGKRSLKVVMQAWKRHSEFTVQLSAQEFEQVSQYCKPYGLVLTEEALRRPESKEAARQLLQTELRHVRRKVLWAMGGLTAVTTLAVAAATAVTGPVGAAVGAGAVGVEVTGLAAFASFTATATVATTTVGTALAGILAAIPVWVWGSVVSALTVALCWAIGKADLIDIGWSDTPGPEGTRRVVGIRIQRRADAQAAS